VKFAGLLGGCAGGAVAAGVLAASARIGLRKPHWSRTSFTGHSVSLDEGAAATAGALAGVVIVGSLPATIAAGTSAIAGFIDDHLEHRFAATGKGLAGHLGALREGRVTTGALKMGLIASGAVVAAVALPRSEGGAVSRLGDVASRTALIGGTANLINLLDLRPGRALKSVGLLSIIAALGGNRSGALAGTALGVSAVCAPRDLRGESMLGDLGANALGAVAGTALAAHESRAIRWGSACIVTGLVLVSERVSFSRVIDANPLLRAIDQWGRP